jgi:hypothetical protein
VNSPVSSEVPDRAWETLMINVDASHAVNERDEKIDRLIDLLGEVSLLSKALNLWHLDFIVGMAILEISEQTRLGAGRRQYAGRDRAAAGAGSGCEVPQPRRTAQHHGAALGRDRRNALQDRHQAILHQSLQDIGAEPRRRRTGRAQRLEGFPLVEAEVVIVHIVGHRHPAVAWFGHALPAGDEADATGLSRDFGVHRK